MGYKRKPKVYRLEFTDPEFEGLVVRTRSLPLGEFMELSGADAATGEGTQKMMRAFARALVEWNLEDELGEPVKPSYDGIMAQDLDFITALITAWMDAIASVSPNLPRGSNSGGTSLEASLPMESLSPSRMS